MLAERMSVAADSVLELADAEFSLRYPISKVLRHPIHTVYIPADHCHAGVAGEWGDRALVAIDRHLTVDLAQRLLEYASVPVGSDDADSRAAASAALALVRQKLITEPVEDLRIDFEDGFRQLAVDPATVPSTVEEAWWDDESAHVDRLAREIGKHGTGTPFWGIRIKALAPETRCRALATLADFLQIHRFVHAAPPAGFRVTVPKVTAVEQVDALVCVLAMAETELALPELNLEIQVETPQAIVGPDGTALVSRMIQASRGRCTAVNFGLYDYATALGVSIGEQSLRHPVSDYALNVMLAAAAGTGASVSYGASLRLPSTDGDALRGGWGDHARMVSRHLHRGVYQGWDVDPLQLVTRYLVTFAFFRARFKEVADRLRVYLDGGTGEYLDDAATARALAAYLQRSLDCGALFADEVSERIGTDVANLPTITARGYL